MAAREYVQGQLFDPKKTRGRLPLEGRTADDWMEEHKDNIVYHGTFRGDWADAPASHFGTIGQAAIRLGRVERQLRVPSQRPSYYGYQGRVAEFNPPTEHVGRVYARRLDTKPGGPVVSDRAANAGHALYALQQGESIPPVSVQQSAGRTAPWRDLLSGEIDSSRMSGAGRKVAEYLAAGRPVRYSNIAESDPYADPSGPSLRMPHSVVAPRGATRSWEDDVLTPQSGVSRMAEDFARQRIAGGNKGVVPFPGPRPAPQRQPALDAPDNDVFGGNPQGLFTLAWGKDVVQPFSTRHEIRVK